MSVIYLGKSGRRPGLTLPGDAVTRTFGIFGVKDSGKTTTARVLAEGIAKLGGYVVILDPVGVWWGITRDGEGRGVPGIVLGGEHADVPLEETGGQLVAELAVAREYPAVVVDLKLLRKGAAQRFMADFLEGVYFSNRRPLHLMFEEADRALPQTPRGMDPTLGRVLGAAEDIVKLGRSRGLGSTFLSQRMATVTKNVTEQVECLVLHAQIGPNDRKAVKAWVDGNGDPKAMQKVMDSMASLDVGEAWVYSPKWLRALERIRVRAPKTLDSSATPTDDEREVEEHAPRAPVDLDTLRERMAETVERAKANDPKALKDRIAELERQLEDAGVVDAAVVEEYVVPDAAAVERLGAAVAQMEAAEEMLSRTLADAREQLGAVVDGVRAAVEHVEAVKGDVEKVYDVVAALPRDGVVRDPQRTQRMAAASAPVSRSNGGARSSRGAESLVEDLSRFYPLWLDRGQLALLLGRGKKSSTLTQHLAEAVSAGTLEKQGSRYRVAFDGAKKAPSAREMREAFENALPEGPRAMFKALLECERLDAGVAVARGDLFRAAGFSPTSSTPVTYLKLLTDNGLAEKVAGGGVMLGAAVR